MSKNILFVAKYNRLAKLMYKRYIDQIPHRFIKTVVPGLCVLVDGTTITKKPEISCYHLDGYIYDLICVHYGVSFELMRYLSFVRAKHHKKTIVKYINDIKDIPPFVYDQKTKGCWRESEFC